MQLSLRFFEYIYLFKSGVLFQIEEITKQCAKIALTEAWDPYDIPLNSTYEDQYFIGGPGDMIEVQEWSDRKPARKSMFIISMFIPCCPDLHDLSFAHFSVFHR